MESDLGKLFIGGISWDTDEERLKEYFRRYGEVVEAMIMRDRVTGRARGFGFILFSDPSVAERVILEKHVIDGRTVEAKKAVPKEDQQILSRNFGSSMHGSSPGTGRTKKIFVGGLASTVTEGDFKRYFDQFGTITDVVVMYDHNTQRPRGFGFITFDSEEAVDRVLHKTFHELYGKMVEVKRAVPKELSPGPNRSPFPGHNYGLIRANSLLNSYTPGYNIDSLGGFGIRMDRFSPTTNIRSGFSQFSTTNYGIGLSSEPGLTFPSYGRNSNFGNIQNGQIPSPSRYTTPIGFNGGIGRNNNTIISSMNQNLWGNVISNSSMNSSISGPGGAFSGSRNGSFGGTFGNTGDNWSSSFASQTGLKARTNYANGEEKIGFSYGRNNNLTSFEDLYNGNSVYGGSDTFRYDLGDITSDVLANSSENFIENYDVSSRGIAA